jgi:hypothetical protein
MGRHDVSGDYIIYDRVVTGHRFRHGEQEINLEEKNFLFCLRLSWNSFVMLPVFLKRAFLQIWSDNCNTVLSGPARLDHPGNKEI